MRVAIVAILLAGCTSLPELEDGVCGNLALDPGEACDELSDRCSACELVCGGLQPGDTCAPGFVCGIDGTCRAPSGVFAGISDELPLSPVDLAITDIDSDDIGDIVALTGTSISVTYGDPSGFSTREARSFVPPFGGAPAFGNLDDDGHTDILLSTPDGIVGFSSSHRVIAPHPFAIDLGTTTPTTCLTGQPFGVFSISPQYLGVLIDVAGRIDLGVIDSAGKDACPVQQVALCTVGGSFDPRSFASDVYDISVPGSTGFTSHVLALATPVGACVATITKAPSGPAPFTLSPQQLASFPPKARPVLAELTGTGCPSLLYSASATVLKEYVAIGTAPACGLSSAATDVTLAGAPIPAGAVAIGHVRLDPPVPGTKKDAIALSSGVYAIADARTSATELYRADRPLGFVQTADLDADGDLDVAAIGSGPTAGADGIDALYRTGASSFLRVRTATRGVVTQFAVGDFDGNEADDIAYTERVVDGDRLSVLYGTRDRLLDPVEAGAFTQVVGLCPMQATDSADPNQLIDDLTIIDLPELTAPPLFTLLHGSPQRTMLSFYDPRVRVFGVPPSSAFTGVSFANLDRSSARIDDVLAVETGAAETKVWPATNTASGLTFPPSTRVDGVPGATRFVAWPLIDRDVMIGISDRGPPRTVVIDPAAFSGTYTPLTSDKLDGFEGLAVKSAYPVAFEDPREHMLVVTLGGTAGFEPMVVLCNADERGVLTGCTDVVAAAGMAEGTVCVDATLANVAPRVITDASTGQQLVMLCRVGNRADLWAVRGAEGTVYTQLLSIVDEVTRGRLAGAIALRAGDVTGDGVDDVLALTSGAGEGARTVLVIPQCASTDLTCQDVPEASP